QRRQKSPDIIRAALAQAQQVDARGEHGALPGQHDGPGVRRAQRLELRGKRIAELEVEGVGLAMVDPDDSDAVAMAQFNHVTPRGLETPTSAGIAATIDRTDSRSAWITTIVSTAMPVIWCNSASGS